MPGKKKLLKIIGITAFCLIIAVVILFFSLRVP